MVVPKDCLETLVFASSDKIPQLAFCRDGKDQNHSTAKNLKFHTMRNPHMIVVPQGLQT